MGKITGKLSFCAYRAKRTILSKTTITSQDVKWFKNNLDTIMARSNPDKIAHVRAVVEFYENLDTKNLDPFFDNLPDKFKQTGEKQALFENLRELSDINESLLKEEKNILIIALLLHDIGLIPEVRNWDHPVVGEKLARALLSKLNFSQEIIDDVAFLVLNHGTFGNMGVDVFPSETVYFPGKNIRKALALRKQILILTALDNAGKPKFSVLNSKVMNELLSIFKHKGLEPFWKYRLRNIFIPLTFACTFGPRMQDEEIEELQLDDTVRKVLNKKLKVQNFSIFQLIAQKDKTYQKAVKLIKLISYIAEIVSKEEYFYFDTDIDFFEYEMAERFPFAEKIEGFLDAMPDEFDLETIRAELQRTNNQSCFGMPIEINPQQLIIKVSLSPWERD